MQPEPENPPEPEPAATIILVRPHRSEFQVYLLKRHARSGFMAGHYVFPGGMMGPEDRKVSVWKGLVDLGGKSISSRQAFFQDLV
jgi:hypothetical protein